MVLVCCMVSIYAPPLNLLNSPFINKQGSRKKQILIYLEPEESNKYRSC